MTEKDVDVEESFQLWRFRHLMTVERNFGRKLGTGESSGVGFVKHVLEHTFLPELIDVGPVISADERQGSDARTASAASASHLFTT